MEFSETALSNLLGIEYSYVQKFGKKSVLEQFIKQLIQVPVNQKPRVHTIMVVWNYQTNPISQIQMLK